MSRYDGLIIPRSYSEYLNKTDSATLSQMLQHLTGLWSHAVSSGDQKPVTSNAVNNALAEYINKTDAATLQQALQLPGVLSETVAAGDNKAVKSGAVNAALSEYDINYDTTVIRDFNLAIPAPGKEKLYLIPANGTQQNKPDSTTVQWLLRANRKPVQSEISNEQRVIQEAICFSGTGHEIKYFIRTATSNDNSTWSWGGWEKLSTKKEYTVSFSISGLQNTQEFKDFILSKIGEWENGDIISCKNSSNQTSKIEIDKVSDNYFNLMYTTYYNTKPQYIRYINDSWLFYEINTTQI